MHADIDDDGVDPTNSDVPSDCTRNDALEEIRKYPPVLIIRSLTSKLPFQVANSPSLNYCKPQSSHLTLILKTHFFKAAVKPFLFPLRKVPMEHSRSSIPTWYL